MGLLANAATSESTLLNPSPPAGAAAAVVSAAVLDLNSPPPSSSSRSSSTSSSSSPPRSDISSSAPGTAGAAGGTGSTAGAASAPVTPSTARKPATSPPSTASVEAEAIKQQLAATTFIQADVLSFREVVQRHTGAADDAQDKMPVTLPARQAGSKSQQQQQQQQQGAVQQNGQQPEPGGAPNPFRRHHMSRLHERKVNNLRNLEVSRAAGSPFKRTGCSPRGTAEGSPKLLYAAGGVLPSPVTPLSSEASFESSNPSPQPQQQQPPLTPTEVLRREFANSLHCSGGDDQSIIKPSNGGVLERFPFLHQHHQQHHQQHFQFQQQQHQQQQQVNSVHQHVSLNLGPSVVHTQLQLGNHQHQHHHHHHLFQQQSMYNPSVMHDVHQVQQQQREPELLDLFPVHATSLKNGRC